MCQDTKQYVNLLKKLRERYPGGKITVFSRETAKQIALESRLFPCAGPSTIKDMIDLLSEDSHTKFKKINRDIRLIDEGREQEILPFERVEEFKSRMKLEKAFESLTKPGTSMKSLAEYSRDAEVLKIPNVDHKLRPLFHRKLTLACLMVMYKSKKYIKDVKEVSTEMEVYSRICKILIGKSQVLEAFRKSRNQLVQEYDFQKCYKGKKYFKYFKKNDK